ncbi:hypothetical protein ACH5RR_001996 [Cinchona calisaya]|uniref:PUM-HD domain-containing protein n=1 Tax=Cinchona calisaya TaxID=153742 RepID=A0ABD3B520_9GENT
MKDDEELELLLGEIPHAISFNLRQNGHGHVDHNLDGSFMTQKMSDRTYGIGMYDDDDDATLSHNKHTCASPVSGLSLQSDGSSSSLLSGGNSLSDNGSPATPPLEELKPHSHYGSSTTHYPNRLWMDVKTLDSSFERKADQNVNDQLSLSRNLSRMYINEEPEDITYKLYGRRFVDRVSGGTVGVDLDRHGLCSTNYSKGFSDYGRLQFSIQGTPMSFEGIGPAMVGLPRDCRMGNLLGSRYPQSQSVELFSHLNSRNGSVNSQICYRKGLDGHDYMIFPGSNLSGTLYRPSVTESLCYTQGNGVNMLAKTDAFHSLDVANVEYVTHYHQPRANARNILPSSIRVPCGNLGALSGEESLIIQGESLNYPLNRGYGRLRHKKDSSYEADVNVHQEKQSLLDCCPQIAGNEESARSLRLFCPFSMPLNCSSLAEAQGYMYHIAKDQHGCRFLQRMFDEGTPQDVQIIFVEIIDHVVELMMNPFGNYLMQKLLEVCNEEQRMQILLRVTAKPGELIRISLNTHGTRVVQKLIETLKSRQQISLVIAALEPGFLALIKDLNGNHVVQRCLQCLSNGDSQFIFVAAAKYCVDIATHQHGCCVLQRCISHSNGEDRENLIAEISANGLLLAQDAFGNYVVQFILELKIPSAAAKLVSQFEGNYVNLATQKFSSHVVEKCLVVCNNEVRSKIIHELLSATHFEQLLQDPHANYVVQTALKVSEGPLHNSLVDTIESHKAMSRNSPYSKRIFSHKLLKK